jgi:hypothetical protein
VRLGTLLKILCIIESFRLNGNPPASVPLCLADERNKSLGVASRGRVRAEKAFTVEVDQVRLCQEDAKASCCVGDEGGPLGTVL